MKLRLLPILAVLSLSAASAQADVPATPPPPGPTAVLTVKTIVMRYWQARVGIALPACGEPQLHFVDSTDPWAALTFHNAQDPCGIEIKTDDTWQPSMFCALLTHEWGHLILGQDYFAASNPADPAHSLDPTDVMFRQVGDENAPPACVPLDNPQAVTTSPAPATTTPKARHVQHRVRRGPVRWPGHHSRRLAIRRYDS